MKTQDDDLICYKHISIDAHGKLKFFGFSGSFRTLFFT